MVKNNTIEVKCNEEEFNKIQKKAEKCGLKTSTFLRMLGLKSEVKVTEN